MDDLDLFDEIYRPTRWDDIQESLEEFLSLFRDGLLKLELIRFEDELEWQTKTGVYLLFTKDERLIWLGSTLDGFVKRKRAHERRFEHDSHDLIVFPKEYDFLAPALEAFLHRRHTTLLGKGGKHI